MHTRRLSTTAELDDFEARYTAASGLTIPRAYLQASCVFALVDRRDEIHGGFVLAPDQVMRWPSQLPSHAALPDVVAIGRCVELNGLWLDRTARKHARATAFWLAVGREIGRAKVHHVVFCVDPRKTGLDRLYRRAASGVLYDGPVINCPLPVLRIYHSTPRRFRWLWLLYAPDLLARVARGRSPRR